MRTIYRSALKHSRLCKEWAVSLDDFIVGVTESAGLPRSTRDRLVTTGADLDDLLIFKPGNVRWWSNEDA